MRPTYAEIRTEALVRNYQLLEARVRACAGVRAGLLAVVKANAYGHDVRVCGRALAAEAAAPWFGVTSVEEAVELRGALGTLRLADGERPRVLVMSGFFPGEEAEVIRQELTVLAWEPWHLNLLETAAQRTGLGPRSVSVHLEIDTGMSRQGVRPGAALAHLLSALRGDSAVWIEGVMTHFSSPEDPANGVMAQQMVGLREAVAQLQERGFRPRWVHAGNSVNAMTGAELDSLARLGREVGAEVLTRPGLGLYGARWSGASGVVERELEPVMCWKTEVTSLRDVPAGTPVGYNETFRAPKAMRLALLPVGYADGLNRMLSNRGSVLVRGQRAPIVGRISMDQTVADVSSVPGAALGDEVVLLGAQGAERICAEEIAELCGTISYEVFCGVGKRVRRVAV